MHIAQDTLSTSWNLLGRPTSLWQLCAAKFSKLTLVIILREKSNYWPINLLSQQLVFFPVSQYLLSCSVCTRRRGENPKYGQWNICIGKNMWCPVFDETKWFALAKICDIWWNLKEIETTQASKGGRSKLSNYPHRLGSPPAQEGGWGGLQWGAQALQ